MILSEKQQFFLKILTTSPVPLNHRNLAASWAKYKGTNEEHFSEIVDAIKVMSELVSFGLLKASSYSMEADGCNVEYNPYEDRC